MPRCLVGSWEKLCCERLWLRWDSDCQIFPAYRDVFPLWGSRGCHLEICSVRPLSVFGWPACLYSSGLIRDLGLVPTSFLELFRFSTRTLLSTLRNKAARTAPLRTYTHERASGREGAAVIPSTLTWNTLAEWLVTTLLWICIFLCTTSVSSYLSIVSGRPPPKHPSCFWLISPTYGLGEHVPWLS